MSNTEAARKVEPSGHDALHVRQVEAMAGYGLPAEDIAQVLRIDVEELRRNYAAELEDGRIKANSRVAENLYRKATGEGREAVTAAIFWLKTRAGWRETNNHEISGRNDEPLTIQIVRFADLPDQQIDVEPQPPRKIEP
jgi:hypothetical protein